MSAGDPRPDPVLAAIEAGDEAALERALEADPRAAKARTEGGVSAILWALYHGRPALAERLAAARGEGDLDLHEAAALGRIDRLEALLAEDREGDPAGLLERRSADGFTPLHLAAFFGRPRAVQALLDAGAPVEAEAANPSRVRPLHSAVAGGDLEVVKALLAVGAVLDPRQAGGYTPLMAAIANGREAIARRLLAARADRFLETDDGKTIQQLADEKGHGELARELLAEVP